nr:cytotoxic T-lymphocyte protein 4 [Pogona vitticeps]
MMALFVTILFSILAAGFTKVMEVTQPAFLVAKSQDSVNFVCEYKNAKDVKELRVTLLKETGNTSIQICASPLPIQDNKPFSLKDGIHCQVHPGHESVNVTLRGLQSTDGGVYVCKIERLYPPPYYPVMGKGTQLYIIDSDPCPDISEYLSIIVTVVAVVFGLFVNSILITVYITRRVIRKSKYFVPGVYEKFNQED